MDFSAHWCGPCKAVAPLFAQMAENFKNLLFLKVDVDANQVPALHLVLPKRVAWCLQKNATCLCTAKSRAVNRMAP